MYSATIKKVESRDGFPPFEIAGAFQEFPIVGKRFMMYLEHSPTVNDIRAVLTSAVVEILVNKEYVVFRTENSLYTLENISK